MYNGSILKIFGEAWNLGSLASSPVITKKQYKSDKIANKLDIKGLNRRSHGFQSYFAVAALLHLLAFGVQLYHTW